MATFKTAITTFGNNTVYTDNPEKKKKKMV